MFSTRAWLAVLPFALLLGCGSWRAVTPQALAADAAGALYVSDDFAILVVR
jgi:hypothetical protein